MNKKKILIVTEVFWPENFIINDLVCELKKKGFHIDILTQYPSYPQSYPFEDYGNDKRDVEMWNGSKIYRFKFIEGYKDCVFKKLKNYFFFVFGGNLYIDNISDSYDYVFVSQTGPLTVSLPAIKAAEKFNAKLILWTLDIWPDAVHAYGIKKMWFTSFVLSKFIKYVYSKCDYIFVSSRMFIPTIKEYVENKEIIYIPNWATDTNQVVSDLEFDTSKFNITFTGNISRYQNLENVIKAFVDIDDSVILNIVGSGSKSDDLEALINSSHIRNVKLHGQKDASQIQDILSKSDALLLSLISDSGIQKTEPFKIQSYLRSGKPILGVIAGAGREIILENNIGICADPDSITDITEKIYQISKITSQERVGIAERARKIIDTRYNKTEIINNIIKYLK